MDTRSLQLGIAYALWRRQKFLPKPGKRPAGWPPSMEEFSFVAARIAQNIERTDWEVRRQPPKPPHSGP